MHRDVKPENILVSDGVHARLLDFGVAKDAQSQEESGSRRRSRGSRQGMAPGR
ncbi:protein kinase [Sorangium sp. So ce291]|uniref:protein kinase domain-containing protein n=1 Tax=Sorangium sp. So ce291 TaxID=3133294 RepID=UPI003F62ED74